jgi:peptidoglycan/xylan/chitin deacetylase (PgdA/CDA1 family)
MKGSAAVLAALTCSVGLGLAGCGASAAPSPERTPLPAPEVTLTPEEQAVWAPLPADRSAIPVLLYHGIGPAEDFSDGTDADYGVGVEDFAKQMTMIHHAGFRTVDLETFVDFVEGKPADLPARPLLLTFDDARADSWTGADGILRELGYHAVMFVDVGRVEAREPEYLTWQELQTMQDSDRWQLQLHSGKGHVRIQYGPEPDQSGPFYAYKKQGESFDGWRERVSSDIEWGQQTLADHDRAYRPLAFAPPYGAYGQEGTNDSRIPEELLGWLTGRFTVVFTQDENARAKPASHQPLGRIQVTRSVTGGALRESLESGTP